MNLREIYSPGHFGLSFELYPPKTEAGLKDLFENVAELVQFAPSYITCTYGAGGSTRNRTLDIVERVNHVHSIPVAAHLTCVGATVPQLRLYIEEARSRGVSYIVALRGDPPQGETSFVPVAGGLNYATELVTLIHEEYPDFGIIVAGYPETHQEALNRQSDLLNLKRKVDAGADVIITQLFYSNEDFFRFQDSCEKLGIEVPIVPGILPVTNSAQIRRITALCGATLPQTFCDRLDAHQNNPQGQFDVGVYYATRQVEELVARGVAGVHFYCLNKSHAVATILRALNLPGGRKAHPVAENASSQG